MSLLFVNACFRDESRTERLAHMWLERRAYKGEVIERSLSELEVEPLEVAGPNTIGDYLAGVGQGKYDHPMFDFAKEFAEADEVLIASPFWNYGLPALLHTYLELVCSQGLTFDLDEAGSNISLCHITRLTFVMTAGGQAVEALDNHAFGYVRTLATQFWHVPHVDCVAAWGLDAPGADIEALLAKALG